LALKRPSVSTWTEAGIKDKSITFARVARDADAVLVYCSGHAMQFGGINYLIPVDAS
jgi:uncharacterized caspase-like protein